MSRDPMKKHLHKHPRHSFLYGVWHITDTTKPVQKFVLNWNWSCDGCGGNTTKSAFLHCLDCRNDGFDLVCRFPIAFFFCRLLMSSCLVLCIYLCTYLRMLTRSNFQLVPSLFGSRWYLSSLPKYGTSIRSRQTTQTDGRGCIRGRRCSACI
jgi:hypothetical protein